MSKISSFLVANAPAIGPNLRSDVERPGPAADAGIRPGDVILKIGDKLIDHQTLPWLAGEWLVSGMQFPPGSFPFEQQVALGLIDSTAAASLPVHPVQLYEAVGLLVMMLCFWRAPLDRYPRGTIAALIVGSYTFLRFFLGYVRADGNIVLGNLTMTQLQCIVLLAASLVALTVQSKSRNSIA